MELQEYIQEVLTQIGNAIAKCNGNQPVSAKFTVNPAVKNAKFPDDKVYYWNKDNSLTQIVNVDFDIAVTSSTTAGGGGKIGLSVFGIGGEVKNEQCAVNRVKFTLPVLFPSSLPE